MNVYKNGNTIVGIRSDGTKFRYTANDIEAVPAYPESIDLKITSRCDKECSFCHERAIKNGLHGNLRHPLLNSIHSYTELAIGGGNPLSHPDLENFLIRMRAKEVHCNLTVHLDHFLENYNLLCAWKKNNLIHGVGVSINEIPPCEAFEKLENFPDLVVHSIAGIVNEGTLRSLGGRNLKLLILGNKDYGKGIGYRRLHEQEIHQNISFLTAQLSEISSDFRSLAFDNLSIKQLNIRARLPQKAWNQFYMGKDGEYTMYIDLPARLYAVSSVSPRHSIYSDDICDLFAAVRQEVNLTPFKRKKR